MAASQRRILITRNSAEFVMLCREWEQRGLIHSGIIVIPPHIYDVGELMRRTLNVLTRHQGSWEGMLQWL